MLIIPPVTLVLLVGAGLLAKASCQSTSMLNDPPHSRASPLPHGDLCIHQDNVGNGPSLPL
ncbi:hypothetical protein C3E98_003990 [Pseudomonas sp. MWU13-2625]|nr:hypothetical protein C3E98_003990 [Pseudomonas sp. MWU13-2625]